MAAVLRVDCRGLRRDQEVHRDNPGDTWWKLRPWHWQRWREVVRFWIPTESCPDRIADGLVMRYEREGSEVIPKFLLSVTGMMELPPLKLEVCR